MCGINGLFSLEKPLPPDSGELIRSMNRAITHRGPDDEGVHVDFEHGIALGHRRLSIIDLSPAAHQPMSDDSGNLIVFNGEIYNYSELQKDHNLKPGGDTEILLSLLSRKGMNALPLLNGMFAFAWYDKANRQLHFVRDRAGKKPIYYSVANGILAFSSEIKALLTLPWISAKVDNQSLYDFLTFNQVDAPATMFSGIYKMAPAERMQVERGKTPEKKTWWYPEYKNPETHDEKEWSQRILDTLDNSVQYRMVSDVPVGAFLSGGVDSSAVIALMRKHTAGTIHTFSVGFDGQPGYDERSHASQIASLFKTEHHEKVIRPDDIRQMLPKMVEIFDEPLADATTIPIFFISQLAHENHIKVVQTGDGADELFAGYSNWMRYANYYPYFNLYRKLPNFIRQTANFVGNRIMKESPVREMLHRGYLNQEFFWGNARAFKENTKASFLEQKYQIELMQNSSYKVVDSHLKKFRSVQSQFPALNYVDWMCYLGFHYQVPNKYLYRMDRLGMANSVEVRTPFLDYNMVNLAFSIPSQLKIKNREPKYVLKKSLENVLPKEILYRKKMGFSVPLREWSGDVMVDYIESNLHIFCSNTGIFREAELRQQVNALKKGNKSYTNNLFTIYFLMAWFKKWM